MVDYRIHLKKPLIYSRCNHRCILHINSSYIFILSSVRILYSYCPWNTFFLFSNHDYVPAKIEYGLFHSLSSKIFSNFICYISLGNRSKINLRSAFHPDAVSFDFNVSVAYSCELLIYGVPGGHCGIFRLEVPEILYRRYRDVKVAIRGLRKLDALSDKHRRILAYLDVFSVSIIHAVYIASFNSLAQKFFVLVAEGDRPVKRLL